MRLGGYGNTCIGYNKLSLPNSDWVRFRKKIQTGWKKFLENPSFKNLLEMAKEATVLLPSLTASYYGINTGSGANLSPENYAHPPPETVLPTKLNRSQFLDYIWQIQRKTALDFCCFILILFIGSFHALFSQDTNALKPFDIKPSTDSQKIILVQPPSVSSIDTILIFTNTRDGFDGSFGLFGVASKDSMLLDTFFISQKVILHKDSTFSDTIGWFASETDNSALKFDVINKFGLDSGGKYVLELESDCTDSKIGRVVLRDGQNLNEVYLSDGSQTSQYKEWKVSFENVQDLEDKTSFYLTLTRVYSPTSTFTLYSSSGPAELEIPFGTKKMSAGYEASAITDYLTLYTVPSIGLKFAQSFDDITRKFSFTDTTLQNCLIVETTVGWDYPNAGDIYKGGYAGYSQMNPVFWYWGNPVGSQKFVYEIGFRKNPDGKWRNPYELIQINDTLNGGSAFYQVQYPTVMNALYAFIRDEGSVHKAGPYDVFGPVQLWYGDPTIQKMSFSLSPDTGSSRVIGFNLSYNEKAGKPTFDNNRLIVGKLVSNGGLYSIQPSDSGAVFTDRNNFLAEAKTADTAYVFDTDNRSLMHYYSISWTNQHYEVDTTHYKGVKEPDYDNNLSLQVYPNSVDDNITVNFKTSGIKSNHQVIIFDILGMEIIRGSFTGDEGVFDVSGLTRGIYNVYVDGKRIKFVK